MPNQLPQGANLLLHGCAATIALGVLPLPYGYYMLLRLVAAAAFAAVAYVAIVTRSWPTLAVSLFAMSVLNPIVPLHLSKDAWACIDGGAAAYLAVVAKHVTARFSNYGPPEHTAEAIAKALGFSVLLGLFAGVGLTVVVGIVVIPLKWLGLSISGKFMNPLAYGAATAAAVAVLSGYAYHSGTKGSSHGDA